MDFHKVSDDKAINELIHQRYQRTLMLRALFGKGVAYVGIPLPERYAIEQHYMDSSTGTLREVVSLWISKADLIPGRYNYDGVRDGRFIECKPTLYTGTGKVTGSGSINDLSNNRHERFIRNNPLVQHSQFFYGILGWIIEFPYKHPTFIKQMEKDLHKTRGRICGIFSYKHWIDCPDVTIRYINKDIINEYRENITGGSFKKVRSKYLYGWLMEQ